jgi:signal transduction histidine kinase
MLRSLRLRLILSHLLPLLLVIPLLGTVLVYELETRVILTNLASELTGEGKILAVLTANEPYLWQDPLFAQAFLAGLAGQTRADISLIDVHGNLVATTDPAQTVDIGHPVALTGLKKALGGNVAVDTSYSQDLGAQVADVLVPARNGSGPVFGLIRLTHRLSSVYGQFLTLRDIIAVAVLVALALGGATGAVLGLGLERPLDQVTRAVNGLATGSESELLPEEGPEELRQLTRAVNHLKLELRNLEENRRHLLANLVHELGRPLGALRSAIQALLSGGDRDLKMRRELLTGMNEELTILQHLVEDLAQLHSQSLGMLELDLQAVAVSEWLPAQLLPWRPVALEKRLHWETSIPSDLPTIRADPNRLAHAFGTLLSNAVKYTPSGGSVSVAAGAEDQEVWIRVSDSGPGIAPEEQERIFTPFYRGRQPRRFPQGMGLGLTIARDLVVAHGGRLELESSPGLGSRFTLHLPCSPA